MFFDTKNILRTHEFSEAVKIYLVRYHHLIIRKISRQWRYPRVWLLFNDHMNTGIPVFFQIERINIVVRNKMIDF